MITLDLVESHRCQNKSNIAHYYIYFAHSLPHEGLYEKAGKKKNQACRSSIEEYKNKVLIDLENEERRG